MATKSPPSSSLRPATALLLGVLASGSLPTRPALARTKQPGLGPLELEPVFTRRGSLIEAHSVNYSRPDRRGVFLSLGAHLMIMVVEGGDAYNACVLNDDKATVAGDHPYKVSGGETRIAPEALIELRTSLNRDATASQSGTGPLSAETLLAYRNVMQLTDRCAPGSS